MPQSDQPLSVSQLTWRIKESLESSFGNVWVTGELSDVARPRSGHIYLTLKDENAQIRGVMWRSAAARLKFELADGLEVVCQGSVEVYPPRGSYQVVIRSVLPKGEGALQLALRQLQQRLAAEGLFNPDRKRPLPKFPRRVAFVTSPTGAAVRDFLEVIRRRWPDVDILVIPAKVQGDGAAAEIVRGIRLANQMASPPDVLVVGRGGGSLEDLWCFNEEPVVRAIYASNIPVISAVGHEIDVTLADLVADVRALTPSEAAELVVPSQAEVRALLENSKQRLLAALRTKASKARMRIEAISGRHVLRRPLDRIHQFSIQLDEIEIRANRAISNLVERKREQLKQTSARLESLSPLRVLGRGYSLTRRQDNGEVLRSADQVAPSELIETRLSAGRLISRIESILESESS